MVSYGMRSGSRHWPAHALNANDGKGKVAGPTRPITPPRSSTVRFCSQEMDLRIDWPPRAFQAFLCFPHVQRLSHLSHSGVVL
jgi:hypothetical protein